MGAIIGAAIIGAAATAGSSAASAKKAEEMAKDAREQERLFGIGDPLSDPVLAALAVDTLSGMGRAPTRTDLLRGSPLKQAISLFMNTRGLKDKQLQGAQESVGRILESINRTGGLDSTLNHWDLQWFDRIAAAAGYSKDQLVQAHNDYLATIPDLEVQFEQLAQMGQQLQSGSIAGILQSMNAFPALSGMPSATAEDIERVRREEEARLRRDINFNADEIRLGNLKSANAANFNPTGVLQDVERLRFNALTDASSSALNRAIAVLGGQQALYSGSQQQVANASNFFNALRAPAVNQALQTANIRSGIPAQQLAFTPAVMGQTPDLSGYADAGQSLANAIAFKPMLEAIVSAQNSVKP